MGVKIKGGVNQFLTIFEQAEQIMVEEIHTGLAYLGEECVKQIREKTPLEGSWTDRTANLRSSIGYAVLDHGADVIISAFEPITSKTTGSVGTDGSKIGQKYVKDLATQYSEVYALVVVAGMNYAEEVEAKGRDVLSGARLHAEQRIEKVMKVYVGRAQRRINALFKKL